MEKKHFKFFALGAFLFLAVLAQTTVSGSLPLWLSHINLALVLVVVILIIFGFKAAAWSSLMLGLILDYFSFRWFGAHTLSLFLTVAAADFVLVNWLTNRSVYSFMALSASVAIAYNLLLYLIYYFSEILFKDLGFFMFLRDFWVGLGIEIFWSCLLVFIFFFYYNSATDRWRPFFLKGNDQRR